MKGTSYKYGAYAISCVYRLWFRADQDATLYGYIILCIRELSKLDQFLSLALIWRPFQIIFTYFQRAALTASHGHGSCSCRCRYSLLARHPESIIAAAPRAKPIAASHFCGISSDCSRHRDTEFACIPIRWTNGLLPTLGRRSMIGPRKQQGLCFSFLFFFWSGHSI